MSELAVKHTFCKKQRLPVGKRIYVDAMKQETQYVFDHERVEILKNAVKHFTMRDKYPTTEEMCHCVCNCKELPR